MHFRRRLTHFPKTKSSPSLQGVCTQLSQPSSPSYSTVNASHAAWLSLQGIARIRRVQDQANTGWGTSWMPSEIRKSSTIHATCRWRSNSGMRFCRCFFCESVQKLLLDLKINVLRDCRLLKKRVLVNESHVIEENDHHNLPSTSSCLCFHERRRLATFLLRTWLLYLRIIVMHPEFIYSDDIMPKSSSSVSKCSRSSRQTSTRCAAIWLCVRRWRIHW